MSSCTKIIVLVYTTYTVVSYSCQFKRHKQCIIWPSQPRPSTVPTMYMACIMHAFCQCAYARLASYVQVKVVDSIFPNCTMQLQGEHTNTSTILDLTKDLSEFLVIYLDQPRLHCKGSDRSRSGMKYLDQKQHNCALSVNIYLKVNRVQLMLGWTVHFI